MAEPTRRVHFVGIGGIGMSGIAELLVNLGYQVSGSDARATDITRRLAGMGVRVHEGHAGDNVGDADVVVVTSAARPDNPEIVEARRRGVPVIARAEMLAELMRLRRTGIAIGGAHGKTTTTSMVALMLERAGLDPTAVIGGRLSAFGSNARLGQGDVIVAEADESDGSFLKLSPVISVITNVDREHLDHYGTFEAALDAFVAFANKVPFDGAVIVGVDDPVLSGLMPRMTRRVVTYATDNDAAMLVARAIGTGHGTSTCEVWRRATHGDGTTECLGTLVLHVPGRHNLRNALAAVGVGLELGLPFDRIASGLAEFRGAERRLQVVGERAGVLVVDDYGHHPTEIAAGDRGVPRGVVATPRAAVPAASLHAHGRVAGRVRRRARAGRRGLPAAHLRRERGPDPRRDLRGPGRGGDSSQRSARARHRAGCRRRRRRSRRSLVPAT